jgi:hypothetical protein
MSVCGSGCSRVAATDFTVLVEGIDPEVGTQFRCRFASESEDWEVARVWAWNTLVVPTEHPASPSASPRQITMGDAYSDLPVPAVSEA